MEEEKRKTHAIIKYQPISNSQIPKPTFMDLPVCYLSVMLSNTFNIYDLVWYLPDMYLLSYMMCKRILLSS